MIRSQQAAERGNILIVAMVFILVISGFVLMSLNVTNNTARLADRSRDYVAAQAGAEGAVEYAYGIWKQRILAKNAAITSTEANASLTGPAFPGFAYASALNNGPLRIDPLDLYGAPAATATAVAVDLAAYPGWRGMTYNYAVRAKLQQSPQVYGFMPGIKRQFQFSTVPLFQAMFFFEHDLEFYKPATMIVSGLVHTNSTAYVSTQSGYGLTFQNNLSYVTGYTETADPPFANTWSGWSPNAETPPTYPNGAAAQVHQVARIEPLGTEVSSVLNTTDTNPNNDSMRELIEPANASYPDPPQIAARRLANKAGIVVTINGASVTVTTQNGTSLNSARTTDFKQAITSRTTIYDQREGRNVDVATLDISKVTQALSIGGVNGFNNVLYIDDVTPITSSSPNPKTIRLQNGGVLPTNGLTIASENPVYIQGDYNTGTTSNPQLVPSNASGNPTDADSPTTPNYTRAPAAVIADAVMFLSNSWSDSNSSLTLGNRVASSTTYNTAILAGNVPSGYQPPVGAQYGYSGGAINLPRFLEDWSGSYCTYYGSMVELFQSKTFTGQWDTGVIYRPPNRCWNFDPNFTNSPPAGSLDAASWSRGNWAKY